MISVNKRSLGVSLVALAVLATACGSDDDDTGTTATPTTAAATTTGGSASPPTTGTGSSVPADDGVTAEGITTERCEANKAAGKITYLSSFDYAAAASIVDVVVAKAKGYFEKMCLDVTLKSGFSTSNYPLIAAGEAQFSSAGNYTEILNYSVDGAEYVATVDYGKEPIEALITPEDGVTALADLKGKTLAVKGDIPPSLVAMLAQAGLERGKDYKETLIETFDPQAALELDIDALPVYKSNEPGQLDRNNVKYHLFDPATEAIPGSFGLIYTSKSFYEKHPTAVVDFTRAALHGMEDAIADPTSAVQACVDAINAAGNTFYLSLEGETYRWTQELKAVQESTPSGKPIGLIDPEVFRHEYDSYVKAGVWPKGAPKYAEYFDADVAASVYGPDGKVIWPAK
jgi:NitT/TauT family transport system substrate-binding protein